MRGIYISGLFLIICCNLLSQSNSGLYLTKDTDTELYGFVNNAGEWVITPIFENVYGNSFSKDDYATVKIKGKWGCINKKGDFIVNPVFSYHIDAHESGIEIQRGVALGKTLFCLKDQDTGFYGFVNHFGNWAIKPIFENVYGYSFSHDNFATVKVKGKWGCINKRGEVVIAFLFSDQSVARDAGLEWQKSDKYQLVPHSQVPNYANEKVNGVQYLNPDSKTEQLAQLSSGAITTSDEKSVPQNKQPSNTGAALDDKNVTQSNSLPSVSSIVAPPTLTLLSPQNGSGYDSEEVTIRYEAKASDGSTPEIMVLVDSEPYQLNTKGVKRAFNEMTVILPRNQERTRVQLIAKDSQGFNSEPVILTLYYTGDKVKPMLHILSIGVGQYGDPNITNLDHAAKDAQDISTTLKGITSNAYREVTNPVTLTNEDAKAVNIKTELNKLVKRVNQDDVVILYFSGHGAKENNVTYFLSSDADADNLYSTAVNFNDIQTVAQILVDKHCKVMMFMDACHAGALYNTKALNETLQFAKPGVITFCSSTNSQKSMEDVKWQNSIFTRALIDGLNGKAKDEKGNITTLELERYIKITVDKETKGLQTPIIENKIGDFILF